MDVSSCVLNLVGTHLPTYDLFTLSAINSYVEWQILPEVKRRDIDVSTYVKSDNLLACQWLVSHGYLTKETVFQTGTRCTVLGFAAFWGSLSVCKWISSQFHLTRDYARKDYGHALSSVTQKGHLEVCIWLVEHFKLTKKDAIESYAFPNAACGGHLTVCQWLHSRFKFTTNDARSIIRNVCSLGHLDVSKWLVDHFSLDKDVDILENNRTSALKDVWDNLPMCRWLLSLDTKKRKPEERSKLPQESEKLKIFKVMVARNGLSILFEADYLFNKAASNCSFDICEWYIAELKCSIIGCFNAAAAGGRLANCQALAQHFGLTTEDIRSSDNSTFRKAAKMGHLHVCKWLTWHFGLTAADTRSNDNYALRMASKRGYLQLCQWMIKTFDLTVDDVRAQNNAALRMAALKGHLRVCQWLSFHFGLTKEDAQSSDNYALKMAHTKGHVVVCKWLVKHFGLEIN